jgi:hypothetical protein
MKLPKDLDTYDLVDADVTFYCPKCKKEVPAEDAFVVVFGCKIDSKKKQVIQIPSRAFHTNPMNDIKCNSDLEIRKENE